MFLFICTALLVALFLGGKLTKDIFPRLLKAWLLTKAISNWMKSQPQKFGKEITPKEVRNSVFNETGIFSSDDDVQIERPISIKNPVLREEKTVYGTDEDGKTVFVKIVRLPNNQTRANIFVALEDKHNYHVSFQGDTPSGSEFSLGNLKIEMAEPFRVWRIWYNGLMSHDGELVHVVLNFLWKALDNPLDNRRNGNATLLAEHLSSVGLFGENLPTLSKMLPEGYSQMGTLHGQVTIGNNENNSVDSLSKEKQIELYLYGFRVREVITDPEASGMVDIFTMPQNRKYNANEKPKRIEFFAIGESGNGVRLSAFDEHWTDGKILWASYETIPVESIDITPMELSNNLKSAKLMNIKDNKGTLRIETWTTPKSIKFPNGTLLKLLTLKINEENAHGMLILSTDETEPNADDNSSQPNLVLSSSSKTDCSKLLSFSAPACLKVPLVGGKGASLAKLQSFGDKLSNSQVKTAKGFCVTTNLFRDLLEVEEFTHIFNHVSTTSLEEKADKLSLEEACSLVMQKIKDCKHADDISVLISQKLEDIFGSSKNNLRFAVRSSGVLEDGSDLSCAGQNETFLGVPESLVTKRVLDCWASLFTVQSVSYRLNHGQPAVSEMAVVVQEMVDAKAAGVIFTADPRTGNPFEMIVTANYGLGESVVSGACDPDTITLIRHGMKDNIPEADSIGTITVPTMKRKWWTNLTIGGKELGEKKVKIICLESSTGSSSDFETTTEEVTMSTEDSKKFCIDDQTAITLGSAAAQIELLMGQRKPVDIEWAVDHSGNLFILQCRNLTALDTWTDFEIMHEMDEGIRTKVDRFTTANTGEVLPKAMHPLSTTLNRIIDFLIQGRVCEMKGGHWAVSVHRNNTCPIFQQRLFLNMYQCMYSTIEKEITVSDACIDQCIFGRPVIDEEIRKTAENRFGLDTGMAKAKNFIAQIQSFRMAKGVVQAADEKYGNFQLDYSNVPKNALDVYLRISEDLNHMLETNKAHMLSSTNSSASQVFLFMFLSEGKKPDEWDSSVYEDASRLLAVFSEVESAEMPNDMNLLLEEIIRYGGEEKEIQEKFLQATPPTKALQWLRYNENVSRALDRFFEKHGHRGICEMDMGEPSWKSDPVTFLPILKSTLRNKLGNRERGRGDKAKISYKNDDELLDSLSSNLKPMTRRLLKFILPTCRNAVVYREKTKSLMVRVISQLKEKYQYLAEIMVQENLLPSPGLIIHLNHFEIGQLIKKDVSSTVILQKAMKRSKLYSHLEKLKFPEISIGMPKEIDTSIPVAVTDVIQATPVSRGVARGVAKVCLSVEEASDLLLPGDILITHGTDIAWSPLFPILGGVVTELGGLISHGAVVAREYGLPCIVGASDATKIFKTGDEVILDAGKGTLSKTFS